ncbi:MAG TPA: phosphate signaling complex protein PhoU [Anaerovoracaceae bacterium]|nr:phosphate signaling complex protein PhoU [Anaerovoracaceae bacterium]
MRNKFDEQLAVLNVELIKMGNLCELAISNVIEAMEDDNDELFDIVRETEVEIDQKEREIENLCLKLLLQQQPVAKDLRTISSAMKMISDMERIGDQAADISEIAVHMEGDTIKDRTHLREMAKATISMVSESVKSFVDKDLKLARKVMSDDDIVDDKFDEVKKEIEDLIKDDRSDGQLCLDILMIAKYLERIGDHAVNVAEWVEYSITGIHVDND